MVNAARRPIVAGNWKMNTTLTEAVSLASALREPLRNVAEVETVLCPPFISLAAVKDAVAGTQIGVGGQNCYFEPKGAFTGEISPGMLADLGCGYVILGHSERRTLLGENDDVIARKVRAAQAHGLVAIVCVGENLEQNDSGETEAVVGGQVRAALRSGEPLDFSRLVIAYEPIWAIGTGRAATAAQANATIGYIRRVVAESAGQASADGLRIQYGGSVTATNAAELFDQPEIDGALVGGASLKAQDFGAICGAARR